MSAPVTVEGACGDLILVVGELNTTVVITLADVGFIKLLNNMSAAKELEVILSMAELDGSFVTDVVSGSVIGCILGVALIVVSVAIVVDDMKVIVIGISIFIVVCGSISLVVANGTTVAISVISADVLLATETSVFEFP